MFQQFQPRTYKTTREDKPTRTGRARSGEAAASSIALPLALPALHLILLFLLAPPAEAAPGDLDSSFGGFGVQGTMIADGVTNDMARAPDGKIVTAGSSGVTLEVRRYMPNGSPDPTFDGDGVASFVNLSFDMDAAAVAVQPDGKIVVAGRAAAQTNDFLLVRVNATGSLDLSFGSAGYRTIDFNGQADHVADVLVQPDGKIVVAGTSMVGGDNDFSVARLTANGSLDATFSGDGKIIIAFGGDDECEDMALQDDGKIVVVGDGSDSFPEYDVDVCLARINPDGTLDNSFGIGGKTTPGLGGYDIGSAIAIQADGKIIVAGYTNPADPLGKLARFLPDGSSDTSLDGDGIMSIPGSKYLMDIAIQPDGRYVVLGDESGLTIYRRLPNGAADPSFGGGDGVESYIPATYDVPTRLALLADGRILVHGWTGPNHYTPTGTAILRLWPDGSLDAGGHQMLAFDENGIPPGSGFPPGSNERANSMAIQQDGKIVVAGEVATSSGIESDFALARFLPDGELDTSFGTYGHVSFSFHNNDVAQAVAIQPDGKIVAAGYEGTGFGINFLVARFLPNGNLDPTFGFGGFNVIDFAGWDDYAMSVAIAPDGKVVLAGAVFSGSNYVFGVARFTSDGVADNSFDGDARQTVDFLPGFNVYHDARAMLVQPDYKIVVGGGVGGDFGIARLNENGSLDDTFGCQGGNGGGDPCSGMVRIDMGGNDALYGLARAPNGWLYAAGATGSGPVDAAIAQFNENGRLETCPPFPCENWPDGKAYMDWGYLGAAYAIDVRSDGQIVIAGENDGIFAWAQFSPNDPSCHLTSMTNLVGQREYVTAVKFTGSNGLVLAGRQTFNGDENFALAKFETTPNAAADVPSGGAPTSTAIETLRPNPSDGNASLTFLLAQPSVVEVGIYAVSGRMIRRLDPGSLPAGRHQASWDGRTDDGARVGAGMFFVRLQVDGHPAGNRRLIVVR